MHKLIALVVIAGLTGCAHTQRRYPELRAELLAMDQSDQAVRSAAQLDVQAAIAADNSHTSRMKSIVKKYGWPTISMVGDDGANAAWLLVQHADSDRAFQLEVLSLMEPLIPTHNVKSADYAYLWDRTHTPQRYGTQGKCAGVSLWAPRQIEAPESVEERRSQVGLGSLAEYVTKISAFCTRRE
jgi:hypothetical protein